MEQFTASEVRRTAAAIERKQMLVSSMLRAYADLLEAREKAVPFGYAYRYWDCIRFDTGGREINGSKPTATIPLYTHTPTHPAPPDAERLAEALRACALNWQEIAAATWRGYSVSASNVDKASANAYMHCAQDIRKALATHSAQAQPPAASVTTLRYFIGGPKACAYVDKPEHVEAVITSLCECTGDDREDYTATDLLAAQENPSG